VFRLNEEAGSSDRVIELIKTYDEPTRSRL